MPAPTGEISRARAEFDRLVDLDPAGQESALGSLAEADPALAQRVRHLLAADRAADTSFLDRAAPSTGLLEALAGPAQPAESPLRPGQRIGPWRLEQEIGRGGMGEVWRAARATGEFEQEVALKVVKSGLASPAIVKRFEIERQIVARLDHPGIARLVDGGVATDGRPYFALELVTGAPLTRHAEEHRLDIESRIRLIVEAARAVAAAHARLIVHRDLKPSNILVSSEGRVKLLDFGIAKLLTAESVDGQRALPETELGAAALTPDYAAPEQILGDDVTTATDVYALGVVLYELLTGRRPHRRSFARGLDLVRSVDAETVTKPSLRVAEPRTVDNASGLAARPPLAEATLARRLRGDLDTILLKALAREPGRRYPTAAAFADDLERHLAGHPVGALPDSAAYRARKFVRRHRWSVVATAILALSLVSGIAATSWQARRADRKATEAEANAHRAEAVQKFLIGVFEGADPDRPKGAALSAQAVLKEGIARLDANLEPGLAVEARTRATLDDALSQIERRLGDLESAERLAHESVELRRALPDAAPDEALARLSLGEALSDRGEFDRARSEVEAALPVLEASFGADSDEATRARRAMVFLLEQRDGAAAALVLAEEILARDRRRLGPDHPDTAASLARLGNLQEDLSDFTAAERSYAAAVAILEGVFGPEHPRTAAERSFWGQELAYLGDYARGAQELEHALASQRKALGSMHPAVGETLIKLGLVYLNQRRFSDADRVHEECRAIFTALDHFDAGTCLRMLGNSLFTQERYAEAAERHAEAYAFLVRKAGAENEVTLVALANLGASTLRQGKAAEAKEILARALAGSEKIVGPEDDVLRYPLLYLGEAERELGDAASALAHHRRLLAIATRQFGEEHLGVATARRAVALDLALQPGAAGRTEARVELDRALAILRKLAPDHPRVGEWLLDSARLARLERDRERERRDLGEAAPRLESAFGAGDPRSREARLRLRSLS